MPNLVRIGPTVWISIPYTQTNTDSPLYIRFVKEGATKKVSPFMMPLEPIYNKHFGFNDRNVFLNTAKRFKQLINFK